MDIPLSRSRVLKRVQSSLTAPFPCFPSAIGSGRVAQDFTG